MIRSTTRSTKPSLQPSTIPYRTDPTRPLRPPPRKSRHHPLHPPYPIPPPHHFLGPPPKPRTRSIPSSVPPPYHLPAFNSKVLAVGRWESQASLNELSSGLRPFSDTVSSLVTAMPPPAVRARPRMSAATQAQPQLATHPSKASSQRDMPMDGRRRRPSRLTTTLVSVCAVTHSLMALHADCRARLHGSICL